MPLGSWSVMIYQHNSRGCHVKPVTHGKGARHAGTMKKTWEGLICNSCWGLNGSNLTLVSDQAML